MVVPRQLDSMRRCLILKANTPGAQLLIHRYFLITSNIEYRPVGDKILLLDGKPSTSSNDHYHAQGNQMGQDQPHARLWPPQGKHRMVSQLLLSAPGAPTRGWPAHGRSSPFFCQGMTGLTKGGTRV